MKLTSLCSHRALPVADPVEVVVLVNLAPDSTRGRATPLDLRLALDRSSSMNEASGVGKRSKLGALKQAVTSAVELLTPGQDQISCVAFDDTLSKVLSTRVVSSDLDKAQIKRDIDALRTGGATKMSDALGHAVHVQSARPDALRRVVLFTDGHVTAGGTGEVARCNRAADEARASGVPLSVFAVGEDYNEGFLRDLAARAGLGSYYAHVSRVDEVRKALADEIAQLRSACDTDVAVALRPGPGVAVLECARLLPQQVDLAADPAGGVADALAALDARGQRYLLKCRLAGRGAGVHPVLSVEVSYRASGRPERRTDEVHLELTDDSSRWSQANPTVLATVVNAAGVRAATSGNVALAKTLFTRSGNAAMVQQLTVLGSAAAAQPQGNAGRALRTIVAQQAHLAPLGSTPPAGGSAPSTPTNGGTP